MEKDIEYLVAYEDSLKVWVVFYNQDRPDSLGERDFETGEQLSPVMCDQITIAQCHSRAAAELVANTFKENQELKRTLQNFVFIST